MALNEWDEIIKEYKAARYCLWCPKHCGNWSKNEDEGYYHMWRAYYLAKSSDVKQALWYARILYMVASEQQKSQSEYILLNRYLKPCMDAYAKAIQSGEAPSDAEYKNAKFLYDYYIHQEVNTKSSEEILNKAYSYIDGWSSELDFQFHDSKVLGFSHDGSTAQLKLQYDETTVALLFEDVYEIKVLSVDPQCTWISEFYCYPTFHNDSLYIFDVGFYKIQCKKIMLLK